MRGVQVVGGGAPLGVDLCKLRALMAAAQPEYRDPEVTDPSTDAMTAASEVEYRAAMGLDPEGQAEATPAAIGVFTQGRVLYDSTLP